MAVKTHRFVVDTDAGGTGLSRQITINGIMTGAQYIYNGAGASTNVTMRGNYSGDIVTIHSEAANNTDKYEPPSSTGGVPRLLDAVYEVYVDTAGGALTPAVTVLVDVLE